MNQQTLTAIFIGVSIVVNVAVLALIVWIAKKYPDKRTEAEQQEDRAW